MVSGGIEGIGKSYRGGQWVGVGKGYREGQWVG